MRVHKKTILLAIKQHLQAHLPDALQSIVLFGSRAWGDAKPYSDYDLLIVLQKPYTWRTREKISELLYDIDLQFGICTQPLVISQHEIDNTLRGQQPIIQKALQNGIYA